ncbi:biotin attachment protein [Bordetella hinzii]|uniref:lipoyl domain-containing protein n=1 Tax=Bordetella hinzii TaxID=103855 RepID=UPI0013EFD8F9|nr:lipoyl domain-containing protein [Bordetella hinzii]QII83624.1 biotin attachment protein [Bordetella hinzii]
MADVYLDDAAWADTEEGTEALLQEWRVRAGDRVEAGQVLGVAELVKTTHDIVAPVAGVVASLDVAAEANFGREAVLARISE